MRYLYFSLFLIFCNTVILAQTVEDNFEGNGTITAWIPDDCSSDPVFSNPLKAGINTSDTVLRYSDTGGLFANVRFDIESQFDLSVNNTFTFKIYVPSSGITGSQTNQVSLKLQDGTLGSPWATQSEIIKPIVLNQWQTVSFDFENDSYINLDGGSPPPIQRTDFNRVVIQVNGENNTDHVLAYIDDFLYDGTIEVAPEDPVYDNLVWSDEFDGTGAIDSNNWHHQTQIPSGGSWYNNEVQHYTNREVNSNVSNGTLKIVAKKETYSDGTYSKNYTSARLNSKFAFKYGRVEVRAKLPSVAGTWPAIWLLGKNINEDGGYWDNEGYGTTNWPLCGEIDIMEPNVAKTEILGTWHWDNGSGYQYNSNSVNISNNETSQNFHDYILIWSPDSMKIYIDDVLINEMSTIVPFDMEFYFLLNIAMGGSLGGTIDSNFMEDSMEIDYIRVYQESSLSVDKESLTDVRFYPNPVNHVLNIKLDKITSENVNLHVLDMSGRTIYKKKHFINENKITYDASLLNPGLFFIQLTDKTGIKSSFKFIKN